MAEKIFPTKSNLMLAKKNYKLSLQGYELLDKKKNILVRELMSLIDEAKEVQKEIDVTFKDAYKALMDANISIGITNVQNIASAIHDRHEINIKYRSVMGVEIPEVEVNELPVETAYGFFKTDSALDEAYLKFTKAAMLSVKLAEIENSVFNLATNIKKTQKRSNALKNIMIPKYEEMTKFITNALDEKEREEFIRSKVIKSDKEKKEAEW